MIACYLKRMLLLMCTGLWLMAGAQTQIKGMLLKEALKKVSKIYGAEFVYDPQVLENKTTLYEVSKNDKPLEDVLKGMLYPNNLVFLYIKHNYYSIVSKDRIVEAQTDMANAINLPSSPTGTKQMAVSGTIRDNKGMGLPRVTVTEAGTDNKSLTNDKGDFRITVRGPGSSLLFSSVGFVSREIRITDNQSSISLALDPAESSMEDVVVVAYGTMRKSDLTGASTAIRGADLVKTPVQTAAEALTGKLAGVQVQRTDGQPGADILINVRGGTSISQDNAPLYVIDGFPSERGLNQISPQDIERIDVLKDASSTAIYGARGGGGQWRYINYHQSRQRRPGLSNL